MFVSDSKRAGVLFDLESAAESLVGLVCLHHNSCEGADRNIRKTETLRRSNKNMERSNKHMEPICKPFQIRMRLVFEYTDRS